MSGHHPWREIKRKFNTDPIPAGADPVWQPHQYLLGCSGWVATTHPPDTLWNTGTWEATPWIVPLYEDPLRHTGQMFLS